MRLTVAVRDASELHLLQRREYDGDDVGELLARAFAHLKARQRVLWIHLDRGHDRGHDREHDREHGHEQDRARPPARNLDEVREPEAPARQGGAADGVPRPPRTPTRTSAPRLPAPRPPAPRPQAAGASDPVPTRGRGHARPRPAAAWVRQRSVRPDRPDGEPPGFRHRD